MKDMLALLADGSWANASRLKAYAIILIVMNVLMAALVFADLAQGRPDALKIGSDFAPVWVAGLEARAGAPDAPFDRERHFSAQQKAFGAQTPLFGWHYPPYFLALAMLLAFLPYLGALALYQGAGLVLYLVAFQRAAAGLRATPTLLAALAFPALYVNLTHGQNGFLTAGLLTLGLLFAPTRPVLAGALLALLAYKPHFLLIAPLVLLIEWRVRAMVSFVVTLAAMTLGVTLLFGPSIWPAFMGSLDYTREIVESGGPGFAKIQSVFAAMRLMGAGVSVAYAVQTTVSLAVVGILALMWFGVRNGRGERGLAIAATLTSTLLTTPYCLDYDMTVLGPALALAVASGVKSGFGRWEITLLAGVFVIALAARSIGQFAGVPIGAATVCMFFVMLATRQARLEHRSFLSNRSDALSLF